jgi:hypothetical protein
VPVRCAPVLRGWKPVDGFILVDLPDDSETGLITDDNDDEY